MPWIFWYSGNVDGYCIVSSDSDFTRLAARLRESGMLVLGMGEEKTPKPFISACNQFKYLDLLYRNQQEEEKKEDLATAAEAKKSGNSSKQSSSGSRKNKDLKRVRKAINAIIEKFSDEEGWLSSGQLGDQLGKRLPDFDVRNYGYSKLTPFSNLWEIMRQAGSPSGSGGRKQIYFRMKRINNEELSGTYEGVTNWVYRNAYHDCFYPMDKYFTPFITAKPNKRLSSKEIKEVSPETNGDLPVIPQVLTNNAEDFVKTAHIFRDEYGHREVNLNLGCPSGTVTAKGKGCRFRASRISWNVFWMRSSKRPGWRSP